MRTHLDVSRDIAAAPAAAWQALTDTRRWPTWGPTIAEVRSDDVIIEAGSTGRVRPRLGPWVPFRITHLDPGTRWTWRVAGIPATGHRVEPTAAGCRVVFEVPLPAAGYALVCHLALRRLARMLEHGSSSTAS